MLSYTAKSALSWGTQVVRDARASSKESKRHELAPDQEREGNKVGKAEIWSQNKPWTNIH